MMEGSGSNQGRPEEKKCILIDPIFLYDFAVIAAIRS